MTEYIKKNLVKLNKISNFEAYFHSWRENDFLGWDEFPLTHEKDSNPKFNPYLFQPSQTNKTDQKSASSSIWHASTQVSITLNPSSDSRK